MKMCLRRFAMSGSAAASAQAPNCSSGIATCCRKSCMTGSTRPSLFQDLDEQVANDPAVKAAKQAYDEAYAKAYAERKKL